MISSIRPKQSISWAFLNDAMAISAREMPKNHTDKAAAPSYFSRANDGVLVPVIYQPPRSGSRRVLDLIKSLIKHTGRREIWRFSSFMTIRWNPPQNLVIYRHFIYYLIYYILNTWKGWFKAVIFLKSTSRYAMESRKRRRDRPARRSLEAPGVDKLNRSIWNGARCRVWLLSRIHNTWKFLKGRSCFRLRSTFIFAVTGDGETREANCKFSFRFFLKEIWIPVLFASITYHTPLFDLFLLLQNWATR